MFWFRLQNFGISDIIVIVTVFKLIILSKTQRKLISSDRKTWKH